MVTLKDVARESGFSVPLVSAVVNGKADQYRISQATREKVEAMARQMGYGPDNNRSARQMAARKHGTRIAYNVIAISAAVEHDRTHSVHHSPFAGELLRGIDYMAYQCGLDVLMCRHYDNKLPRFLEQREVDGIIPLVSTEESRRQIEALGLPMVQLIGPRKGIPHSILIENKRGMWEAVRHLVKLGHRHIAYIGQEKSSFQGAPRERYAGYEQAMREGGLPLEYVDVTRKETTMTAAGFTMDALWERSHGEITAVACYNDVYAMGAIRSLRKRGLRVPEDVSVTGFDDVSEEYSFEPRLTSVYFDRFQLGQRAVEVLFHSRPQWLAGEAIEPVHEIFPVQFVERGSTAPPRID
jgi:DNA-binding LacI/PurR family transcriptional regulator